MSKKEKKEKRKVGVGGEGKKKWRAERKQGNNMQIFRNESDDI